MTWDRDSSPRELITAVESLDRPRVAALCEELTAHLRSDDRPYPLRGAQTILQTLRRKRHFLLLQQVADALIQSGTDEPTIRRQYAQALLDQGILEAAVAVLERLLSQTAGRGHEDAEARGLLGRAYKQMFLATAPGSRDHRRRYLDRAIRRYLEVYRESGSLWHGINAVALLDRARREGIDLPDATAADPAPIAAEILAAVDERGDAADRWDHGTAVEACIALDCPDDALRRLDTYLAAGPDAFEVASTLRQLQQVWDLDAETAPGTHLIPVLKATLLAREGTEDVAIGPAELSTATLDRISDDAGFEKVLGTERFDSLMWFRTALRRCHAVARIEDPIDGGIGTGFLVRGPDLHPSLPATVLLTNAHVVAPDDPPALIPERALVTFRALAGETEPRHVVRLLWTSPPQELDATILELDGIPDEAEPCPVATRRPLLGTQPPPQTYIIGHPSGGEQVMLSIRDNLLLDADERRVHYRTPTLAGSSGSPVFNRAWELIALHHAGLTRMPRLNGQDGTYPANEGIWIDQIIHALNVTP